MLEPIIRLFARPRLAAFEKTYGYDLSYARDILEADVAAFMKLTKVMGMGRYRKDLSTACWYAAKITGAMAEDCGPCTQLVVTMAEREGVSADVLRAVVARDDAALPADVRAVVRFARASLGRDAAMAEEGDALREEIVKTWGERALVSIAFALAVSRMYPTVKYTLGYGKACTRVVVGGRAVVPGRGVEGEIHAVPA